jgi:hypothetical protein
VSPRRRYRARATVLSAVAALVALNGGLVVLLAYRPDLRDPLFYGKEDRLEEQLAEPVPGRITIVAIGSSRTANAFHPPTVEREVTAATGRPCLAFNAAVLGRGPIFQALHLKRLLARGIHPDILVVEIVPSLYAAPDGKPSEIGHLRADRLTWEEIQEIARLGYSDPEYRSDWRKALYNPYFAFRFQLLGLFQPRWTPPEVIAEARAFPERTGWQPYTDAVTPESYRKGLEYARGGHFEHLQKMEPGRAAVEALREVFEICRAERITPVVALVPEGSDFRSWYGPEAKALTTELIAIACAGADGRVIDARDWLPDDAFADGHHMLHTAAPIYTGRLTKELIIPALKPGSR